MNASQLWQILVTTKVPDDQLKTLAYDLYYQKATAEGNASYAVAALAPKLGIEPRFAYEAFKRATAMFETDTLGGDRKKVLEWLAHDYQKQRAWEIVSPITKAFVDKIAQKITIIKDVMAKNGPPPPTAGKPTHAHAAAKPAVAAAVAAVATKPLAVPAKARVAVLTTSPDATPAKESWKPQLIFFIGGTLASLLLSIRNARHRFTTV